MEDKIKEFKKLIHIRFYNGDWDGKFDEMLSLAIHFGSELRAGRAKEKIDEIPNFGVWNKSEVIPRMDALQAIEESTL